MTAMLIKQRDRLFHLTIPRSLKIAYVWGKGLAILANRKFRMGERVAPLKGTPVGAAHSTPEAVQVTETEFLDTEYLVIEDFINHSCSPNTMLNIARRRFVAIKDIQRNDEITFNYLTTEWDMKEWGADFKCLCGSQCCLGHIKGFRYLTRRQQSDLKPLLSPFLLTKLSDRIGR